MTAAHLGGHTGITQMDAPLFDWLVAEFKVRSMLDVGCGPGGMLVYARSRGLKALGVDGDEAVTPDVLHDFTVGPWPPFPSPVDLVWSVEFVEHVEERFIGNFLPALSQGRVLFMTHAVPGQDGHHHVNCQLQPYWVEKLGTVGLQLNQAATDAARRVATNPFCQATGAVFVRIRPDPV